MGSEVGGRRQQLFVPCTHSFPFPESVCRLIVFPLDFDEEPSTNMVSQPHGVQYDHVLNACYCAADQIKEDPKTERTRFLWPWTYRYVDSDSLMTLVA